MSSQYDNESLDAWLEKEFRFASTAMMRSVSATHLTRIRPGFAQRIAPKRGSVVASPEFGDYDPDPDYFFHWLRDSSLVMDAVRESILAGVCRAEGHTHFADFIRFSLSLSDIDPAKRLPDPRNVGAENLQYLRSALELRQITGDRLLAEARYNPDGSLDIIKWARPQLDGPALRALTLMRYWPICHSDDDETKQLLHQLILQDLDFVRRHCHEPSYDLWEEELGLHYYTQLVHLGSLIHGKAWLQSIGATGHASDFDRCADYLTARLDKYWSVRAQVYLARSLGENRSVGKDPDIAVILGVLHALLPSGSHSVSDIKIYATLARLEGVFAESLEINQALDPDLAPALGRYPGDRYYGGGAFYLATLAAAEFNFRLAERVAATESVRARNLLGHGDSYLTTVRRFTPSSGELSEQFDGKTGQQTSAKNLAWSYAAFITAYQARSRAKALL